METIETTADEVIEPDSCEPIDYQWRQSEDNDWSQSTPHSSPESSSGYQSTEISGDENIDSVVKDKSKDISQEERDVFDSDWNYEDFNPENPYRKNLY